MSFSNKYAILKLAKNNSAKFTLSIDEIQDNKIRPVLLIVPNSDEDDHEHIVIEDIHLLARLIDKKIKIDHYSLSISDGILTVMEAGDNYCSIELLSNYKEELSNWIISYLALTEKELLDKYHKELSSFYKK